MPRAATTLDGAGPAPAALRNPSRLLGLVLLLVALFGGATSAFGDEARDGHTIFTDECARCHGLTGLGTKRTSRPLTGEKSPAQLAKAVERTMPEDDPGELNSDESRLVADYIYGAFYSPDAQARLHPPHIALSHLTVGQYRNAVADVIGSFRPTVKLDGKRGLNAEYFASKDPRGDRRVIERVDPQVNFDFGTGAPDAKPQADSEDKADKADGKSTGDSKADAKDAKDAKDGNATKFNPKQFCIRWEGSVLAEETGEYEFVVHTEQALRLWVNDPKTPAIDAMVKSGNDTEYRAVVYLLAGRSYPVRLEVYKGRELSEKKDEKKNKKPAGPTKASVALLWKVPGRQVDELVPSRDLSPVRSPEVAVVRTPFPPDDRSYGWERGTSVSREWVSATADAAMDVAGYVSAHLPELAGVSADAKDDKDREQKEQKLRAFCTALAERAFGRPLTDAEKQRFVDRSFKEGAGDADLELAVKRVVIRVLASPQFLYPDAFPSPGGSSSTASGYAVASRLALVLWDSLPDQALLDAAKAGKLSSRDEIAGQARRMLDDPRAKLKIRQALLAWLRVDQAPELAKDKKKFPDFDPAVAADLRTSLEMTLDDVVSSESSDFRQLLLTDELYLNGRLAKFYGADLPPDSAFTKMKLDPGQRAGVLTHPYVLATYAYPRESSPIHRGVFIIRGLLGVTLRPPANAAFTPLAPESHPDLTTRERVSLQTSQESCATCHGTINPLGFPLERFDAVGRRRDTDNGKPIDATGHYETRAGTEARFDGARELAKFLADTEETHDAFAQQLFQHLVKQPVRAYGLDEPRKLQEAFSKSGYSIRKLVVEIATDASQPPPEQSGPASNGTADAK